MSEHEASAAAQLLEALHSRSMKLGCAESCTGGLICAAMTDVPGSSRAFWGGIVAYDNEAKIRLLGVKESLLASAGAVSGETALAMAAGLLERTPCDVAVAATGIAGPEGGSPAKPVGTVYIGFASRGREPLARKFCFEGGRKAIRRQTVEAAISTLMDYLSAGY